MLALHQAINTVHQKPALENSWNWMFEGGSVHIISSNCQLYTPVNVPKRISLVYLKLQYDNFCHISHITFVVFLWY